MINKLRSLDLDFNDLFILECFYYKDDRDFFDMFTIPSIKDFNLSTRYQFLKKREYLIEDPNDTSKIIISVKGKTFMEDLLSSDEVVEFTGAYIGRIQLNKTPEECFEEWWKVYPTNTSWSTNDKATKFTGSRVLKNITKAKAKKIYFKLLNQGLKHEELVGSLKYEIKLKKLDSIKKNANQMEFFKGIESYLNQERYLLFIENYRENPDFVKDETGGVKSKKANVKDI